jgi:hypothetical protein
MVTLRASLAQSGDWNVAMTVYGYARVSIEGTNVHRPGSELAEAGTVRRFWRRSAGPARAGVRVRRSGYVPDGHKVSVPPRELRIFSLASHRDCRSLQEGQS